MTISRCNFIFSLSLVLPLAGCPSDPTADETTFTSTGTEAGDGDGDTGDGDGDTGDGDGDGDGDPGDGDSFCAHQCMTDDDCLAMGQDLGLTCQDSVCTGDASSGCTGDAECVALLSGWSMPCTAGGGECDGLGQVCVQADGGGLCATPPSEFFMCNTVPGWAELEVPDIDGALVIVCGNGNAVCSDENFCFSPCQADTDCAAPSAPICDTNTGFCGCGSDADCATIGQPHLSVCNAGTCGCGDDQQCIDGNAGDVCTGDGFCGCSGDGACANVPNSFDGGMISCVQP
jgi:hypothetical protein